jgi:DNA-binding IclR family transcriptional regulator
MGHIDGKPFSVTKLSNYLEAPRATTLRRLDQLIEFGVVERRGNRYFINEEVANTKPAMTLHSALVRVVKETAAQLEP